MSVRPLREDEVLDYKSACANLSKNGKLIIPGTFVWQKDSELFNSSYGFLDGQEVFEYFKMFSGGEKTLAKTLRFDQNSSVEAKFGKTVGNFKVFDLTLGIEICADRGVLMQNNISGLDIHLIISCGLSCTNKSAARAGGYYLGVNGLKGTSECYFAQQF